MSFRQATSVSSALLMLVLLLAPSKTQAQPADPTFRVSATATRMPSKSIRGADDSLRTTLLKTSLDYSQGVGPSAFLATTASVSEVRNRFAAEPERWGDVRAIDFGGRWVQYFTEEWGYQAFGGVSLAAERGISPQRGTTYIAGVIAQHRFGPDLTLGAGVIFFDRLERSNRVLPVVYLDWTVSPHLQVSTANGVIVRYDIYADRKHTVEGSFLWASSQFRAESSFPGVNGRVAVEEKGWTFTALYRYRADAGWTLEPFVMLALRRDFEVRQNRAQVERFRTGAAPGFGLTARFRF